MSVKPLCTRGVFRSAGSAISRIKVILIATGRFAAAAFVCMATSLVLSDPAGACTVCIPFPTKTTADYLVESEAVVLARENPDKPWSYIAVETLKGDPGAAWIDQFINSRTRRLLERYPERGVVLVQNSKDSTTWRNLGFADEDYEQIVRDILQKAPAWQDPDTSTESRLAFFADFLGHNNRALHELAYLEVGRAPYGYIKKLSGKWPLDDIRTLLRNSMYFEWHPLAILMLAQSDEEADREYIAEKFTSLSQVGLTTNLAAWTTALIEIKEAAAVTDIENRYFQNSARNREELIAVILALSEHGSNGHTHLRDEIVDGYTTLLGSHPEMANFVANDLMKWRRWELSDQMQEILDTVEGNDPLGAFAIRMYLAQARAALADS